MPELRIGILIGIAIYSFVVFMSSTEEYDIIGSFLICLTSIIAAMILIGNYGN